MTGAIFESWVVAEILKAHHNAGDAPRLSFFPDAHGLEVDILIERGAQLVGVEVKSGATVPLEAFAALESLSRPLPELSRRIVLHGGQATWQRQQGKAISYRDLAGADWLSS